jgi:hypothetical protein
MALPGNYDAWLLPPDPPEATDDPGTACRRFYPADSTTDAYECEARTECPLCGGVVCAEHDEDSTHCEGQVVHLSCHRDGCRSRECADDARDDYLLARAGM